MPTLAAQVRDTLEAKREAYTEEELVAAFMDKLDIKIGEAKESAKDITVIGTGVKVPSGTVIPAGEMISEL